MVYFFVLFYFVCGNGCCVIDYLFNLVMWKKKIEFEDIWGNILLYLKF